MFAFVLVMMHVSSAYAMTPARRWCFFWYEVGLRRRGDRFELVSALNSYPLAALIEVNVK